MVHCRHLRPRRWQGCFSQLRDAVDDTDAVLPVKQREYQAVRLKFLVVLPTVVGIEELVAVVELSGFNTVADGKGDF